MGNTLLRVSCSVYEHKYNTVTYRDNVRIFEHSKADTPYRFPMSCQNFILIYQEAKEPDV